MKQYIHDLAGETSAARITVERSLIKLEALRNQVAEEETHLELSRARHILVAVRLSKAHDEECEEAKPDALMDFLGDDPEEANPDALMDFLGDDPEELSKAQTLRDEAYHAFQAIIHAVPE